MRKSWIVRASFAIGCSVVAAAPAAWADDAVIERLMSRVDQLEAELAAVRGDQASDWMSEARAAEIRSLVHDVVADADARASFLQSGQTSGYDGGFFIGSADGNFKLTINGQIQARFVLNLQDSSTGGDDTRYGFENRRTKVKFKGHIIDPSWKFFVNPAFRVVGGAFALEEAGITKKFDNGWSVTFGQVKMPFTREELVSSSRQLTVDRSLVNEVFNLDRSAGIMAGYEADSMRFNVMVGNGARSRNDLALSEDTEFAITARLEGLLAGSFGQFKGFTSPSGAEWGMMLGAAAHYQVDEYGTTTNDDEVERLTFTADASLVGDGWNAFAAVIYDSRDADIAADIDRYGIVAQAGMMLSSKAEGFVRYEWADFDSADIDDLSVLTAGFNYYFNSKIKLTTDVSYGFNAVSLGVPTVGWRPDSADDDGQIALRSQIQLLF